MRSGKYRPIFKLEFWVFAVVCVALGFIGSKPPEGSYVVWGQILTVYYFAHFIIFLPLMGLLETAEGSCPIRSAKMCSPRYAGRVIRRMMMKKFASILVLGTRPHGQSRALAYAEAEQ